MQMRRFEQWAGDMAVNEVNRELKRQKPPMKLDKEKEAELRKGKSLFGALKHVTLDNVQNVRAIMELHRELKPGVDVNQAILKTHAVQYVSTIVIQAGSRITSAIVEHPDYDELGPLLTHWENRAGSRRAEVRAEHEAMLAEFGLTRESKVLNSFDVKLTIEPFSQTSGS
jgi:hypothetical protein